MECAFREKAERKRTNKTDKIPNLLEKLKQFGISYFMYKFMAFWRTCGKKIELAEMDS